MKVAIALAVLVTAASGPASAARFLEVPVPAKRLEILLGTWKGDALLIANGRSVSWKPKWTCGMSSGGWGVTCKLSGKIPGVGQYDETDVFGYDEGSDLVHWFSTSSRGEVHDHSGRWIDGKTLQLEWRAGHKFERLTLTIDGPEIVVKSDVTVAGKPTTAMTIRLRK
jgi:hypothetical protein